MKTSTLLHNALEQILNLEFSRKEHAVSSMGFRTHFAAEDVEKLGSIGSLLRVLDKHAEHSSPRTMKSATQRLFVGDAYSFLTEAARQLGYKTVSDLDEFGSHEDWSHMWEISITNATLQEQQEEDEYAKGL